MGATLNDCHLTKRVAGDWDAGLAQFGQIKAACREPAGSSAWRAISCDLLRRGPLTDSYEVVGPQPLREGGLHVRGREPDVTAGGIGRLIER